MTTANHVVLANLISGLDGDYDDNTQVFVKVHRTELAPGSATVRVSLHDAIEAIDADFTVTVQEV